jgi:amylosucrase
VLKKFFTFNKQGEENFVVLMLDFVVNHTSDEFEWVKRATVRNKKYQNYYYTYPIR